MKKIKAVLFDMDGLMIDSESLHFQAFSQILKKFGKIFTEEENIKIYIGTSDADCAKDMVFRFNLPISAARLLRKKRDIFRQLLKNQLIVQPGLFELLKELSENSYEIAIGSSSTLETIKTVIDKLKISSLIDAYASAEEVKRAKPAPDIYLLAAKKLGVKPEECLVLEDAPKGVEAGKLAGMHVFVVPSRETKGQDFALADKVLNSLSEVFELINP